MKMMPLKVQGCKLLCLSDRILWIGFINCVHETFGCKHDFYIHSPSQIVATIWFKFSEIFADYVRHFPT
jgi:hypothetical protein